MPRITGARLVAILLFAITLLCAALIVFPYYWMFASATSVESLFQWPPRIVPEQFTFEAFVTVFTERPIFRWLQNTAFVSLATAVFCTIVSINAGYALSRFNTKLTSAFSLLIMFSQMLPAALIVVPLYVIFRQLGLYNSLLGLAVADSAFVLPLATWLMKGFFDRIPRELEQAAMIDGANQIQALWMVVLPLAKPGLAASTVYLVLTSWSEFIFARTLVDRPNVQVLTVGMQSFVGEQMVDWSMLMAAGTISVLPAIVLFVFLEPFLVSGMTKGALAGT
jgi:multiple sugar transport system permease protein